MENATLVERIEITPELLIIRVKPDAPIPPFACGQYVALGLPSSAPRPAGFPAEREPQEGDKIIKRAYSIGSTPENKDYLEFYIAIVPDGSLTSRLVMLEKGARLFCAPKIIGTFNLNDVEPDKNLVLVSTGTGLAPFISMIRTDSTWTNGRQISILHGVRFAKDLAYQDEINQLISKGLPLKYYPVVSRETPTNNEFVKGYVQHLFANDIIKLDPSSDHVFLCGNPAMIDDVEKLLLSSGYSVHSKKTPGNLHLERYW